MPRPPAAAAVAAAGPATPAGVGAEHDAEVDGTEPSRPPAAAKLLGAAGRVPPKSWVLPPPDGCKRRGIRRNDAVLVSPGVNGCTCHKFN